MAAFTTKATGNWSSSGQTTWNESGVPGSGDTVTITHAITGDTNITIDGIAGNGTLTMAAGKILTLQGNAAQGNAAFILSAGAGLVFSTSGGDRKWLQGTSNSQGSCKIVANGTAGNHCTISKIGAGHAWFDVGGEGDASIINCGGWECTYTDFSGIDKTGYTMAIGSADFGAHHRRFDHCTFTNCGALFLAHPYQWGGSSNNDFYFRSCTFDGVPAHTNVLYFRSNATGSGTTEFTNNGCNGYIDLSVPSTVLVDYNYFGNGGSFGCTLGPHNFVRETSRLHEYSFQALTNIYLLADHQDPADPILGLNEVGNPHFWDVFAQNTNNTGNVLEFPHEFNTDGGDGHYSTAAIPDNVVLTRSISLPSMTDDGMSAGLLAMGTPTRNAIVQHNTVMGRGANVAATERDHSGTTVIAQLESNLIVGLGFGNDRLISGAVDWATPLLDILLPHAGYAETDVVPASACKNNDIYYPSPANFGTPPDTTGLVREGWAIRMTNPVDATNRNYLSGSPVFVDSARCCATYATTFLGATPLPTRPALPVNHGNASWVAWLTAKRAALDVFHTALMANPALGTAVWTWVRAGFVPTNAALDPATPANQGTDGLTRGAMEFAGAAPPPTSGRTGRIGKGGHGRARHS